MKRKKALIYAALFTASLAVLIVFAVCFFNSSEMKGLRRQHQEEELAEQFIRDASFREMERKETETEKEPTNPEIEESVPADQAVQIDLDYTDDNYEVINGIRYTPDYALGTLDCVLEIPKIKMRRGIYTGSVAEIQHDLDIWMATTAHTGYTLGETHYCIYGHNSPTQDLSFNKLKYVTVGDVFLLTTEDSVFLYDVTDFFPQWRELVKKDITDNFSISSDKCYIITCGRDEYRYRDILVEGTLRKRYSLKEWNERDLKEKEMQKSIQAKIEQPKEATKLSAIFEDDVIKVTLLSDGGEPVKGERLCITDENGMFVPAFSEGLATDENGTAVIPAEILEPDKLYAIGAYEMKDESLSAPADLEIRVTESRRFVSDAVTKEMFHTDGYLYIWAGTLVLLAIATTILYVSLIREIKNRTFDKHENK